MPITEPYERTVDESIPTAHTAEQAGCPDCGGHVVTSDGETACVDCGLVLDDQRLDHGPEWHQYEEGNDERGRTGAPLTPARHDRGLTTDIGRYRDANGNELDGTKRRQLSRLRREHERGRLQSTAERNLAYGLGDVRRIVSALGLPTAVRDRSCTLFRSAQDADLLRGRSIEAIAAASVYAACRCNRLPHPIEEVGEYARCDTSGLSNAYRVLNRDLELPTPPLQPAAHVPRLAADLDADDAIRHRALTLARQAADAGLTNGVQPTGFAAACLYEAAREHGRWLTQAAVAEVADISTRTIQHHRDALCDADIR
ncbi:transcription initiation factor IIB family protein [Halococcus sp. PRR34]|uniref:transcription initiation factor IIB n=1 Tax=Halococcus sp. PRR34 TaxID=3020830 RepID=UPI0023613118|nr:transcription initiation factor IIB family protein [Halococcus sp. PRR34]